MFNFRRFVATVVCTGFVVRFACTALASSTIGKTTLNDGKAHRSVSAAQQLAQNALGPAALRADAATGTNTRLLTPSVTPTSEATIAAVTPPAPAASQNPPANDSAVPARAQTSPSATPAAPLSSRDRLALGGELFEQASLRVRRNPINWVVHAYKTQHRLDVYFRGHIYRTYHAVFGRSRWMGAKEWEGDLRTPEGNYLIVSKHPSRRFGWFLRINYPNAIDEARFDQLRANREIPDRVRAGGQIGIHGTDNPMLNVGDVNWTTGCISVDNDDIEELAAFCRPAHSW